MTAPDTVILADADNTLWDTDALFAGAQLRLLSEIDGRFHGAPREVALRHVRSYDQAIAAIDHRHLRYPPSQLVKALSLAIEGYPPPVAAQTVTKAGGQVALTEERVEQIVARYFEALSQVPPLLQGVREGLEAAHSRGIEVWVLTEGAAERQRERAKHHGIDSLIKGISEVAKTQDQFARQRRRFEPARLYVIGDQPDRDTAPAMAAGCVGVLVASRFRPEWVDEADWLAADHVAELFDEAVSWILARAEQSNAAAV